MMYILDIKLFHKFFFSFLVFFIKKFIVMKFSRGSFGEALFESYHKKIFSMTKYSISEFLVEGQCIYIYIYIS